MAWELIDNIRGPKGEKGDSGTLSGAAVTTLPAGSPATVSLFGPVEARSVAFGIPQGAKGEQGVAGTLSSASAESVPAGAPAEVIMSGTTEVKHALFKIPRGLPGLNGVENDEAFATYLEAIDTETRAAAGRVIADELGEPGSAASGVLSTAIDQRSAVVKVDAFGAAGNGVADDTAAFQAAITAADGKSVVVLTAGKTYRFTQTIINDGRPMRVDAAGATILVAHDGDVVSATGATSAAVAVTSMTATTRTDTVSGTSRQVFTMQLSAPAPADWGIGDIIKIAADDIMAGSRDAGDGAAEQCRAGAFLTFVEGGGTQIVCTGVLDDLFTTNIRVGKVDVGVGFSWSGGTIVYADSAFYGKGGEVFKLNQLVNPIVEGVTIPRIKAAGVALRRCVNWQVRGCFFGYGVNDLTINAWGYGVYNVSSQGGTVDSCRFTMLRHAYVNGGSRVVAGTMELDPFGRPSDTTVVNCVADSCTSTAYDSHTQGIRETFANCIAKNSSGFFLRGFNHTVTDSIVVGSANAAVIVAGELVGGESAGHRIDGLYADSCYSVLEVNVRTATGQVNRNVRDDRIVAAISNVVSRNQRMRLLNITNGTVVATNWLVHYAPTNGSDARLAALVTNSRLYVRDMTILMGDANSYAQALVGFSTSGNTSALSECELDNIRVIGNGAASFQNVVNGGNTSQKLSANRVVMDNPPTGSAKSLAYAATSGAAIAM